MIQRIVLACILLGLGIGPTFAQDLTISPYSRYGIGDILSATTTRNAAMGGLSIAPDNYFSINRVNPASYGDIYYTTMDVSGFWQASQLKTDAGQGTRLTAGIQNAAFAFPSNNNVVFTMGFSPFSSVGYEVTDETEVVIADSTLIQETTYNGTGGLNQAYLGAAVRLLNRRLRIGVNGQFNFGNTNYNWTTLLYRTDSILATDYSPLLVTEDVYVTGLMGTLGFMYEDTINANNLTFFRIGGMVDYSFGLNGDRFTTATNGLVQDTLGGVEIGSIVVPPKFGLGFMVNRLGHWSIGADATYQDWSMFEYFGDASNLGEEIRFSLGGEFVPDLESTNYFKRIDYRAGAYYNQTYLQFDDEAITDYGVTFGFGLPADLKGNSRFNRGRTVSRINLSFELGKRGNLAAGFPMEELYARIRLGATINDRWFVRRVVD